MKNNFYLHLGENVVVNTNDIIGIFDIDSTTVQKKTRDYLSLAEKSGEVININYEIPKSFVVCKDKKGKQKVYLSQISLQTLTKRIENFDYELL